MPSVNDFPNELLLNILGALSRNEMLELRMVNKRFAAVGLTFALAGVEVPHVHPSAEAMSRLLAIREDTAFAAAIQEVEVLTAQEPCPSIEELSACPIQARHLLRVPWPQSMTRSSGLDAPIYYSYSSLLKQAVPVGFQDNYHAMLQALRKLPNLKRVLTLHLLSQIQTSATATFIALPDELLLKVLGYLSWNKVLIARLICKKLARNGLTQILGGGQILHIHITRRAMSHFLEICDDSVFAASVREISFVVSSTRLIFEAFEKCPKSARHLVDFA